MLDSNLYNAIRRYAARLLSNDELAKDITQEVFLRMEQNRQAISNPYSWAYRTARNLIIDYYRHRGHAANPINAGEMLHNIPSERTQFDPSVLIEKKESINMMIEKINCLSLRHREVLRLKFQEGLKYAEIAEVINEPITTVSWLLHEAICKLRKELNVKDSGN
ncbi:MAG: RNA polymerase sigma factor [Planctomycetaceae bacterium]|jgi:RNA polymerase sigma-70 factor (ECF subfamily)|nr:RNA polymerase sigma factor [Planctomycetaceae bacterium]